MVQLKRSHPGINRGTFVVMGRKGPNVRFGSLADITFSSDECPHYLQRQFGLRMGSVGTNAMSDGAPDTKGHGIDLQARRKTYDDVT
jgi:hypothetical protein